jgi:hypothetical protein
VSLSNLIRFDLVTHLGRQQAKDEFFCVSNLLEEILSLQNQQQEIVLKISSLQDELCKMIQNMIGDSGTLKKGEKIVPASRSATRSS